MDAGLFALPLAVMGMVIAHYIYQYSKAKLAASTSPATQAEIEQLKRRVATLEQLLTDGDRKLASDIDRLRRTEEFRPGA